MHLTEHQKKLLEVLLDIDSICRKHGITYYLAGGTLLGAVRHNGFIPWDDDIDLMMTREQYDKFIDIAHEHLPDKYFMQCAKFDSNWKYEYTKIRINDTAYPTNFSDNFPQMHQGIFIDIFVQDKTSKYRLLQVGHYKNIQLWHGIVRYKWMKEEARKKKINAKRVVKGLGFFINLTTARKQYLSAMKYFCDRPAKYLLDSSGMHLTSGAYLYEWLNPPAMIDFEGHKFPCPNEYDKYLIYLYGNDYMIPKQEMKHGIEAD